MNPHDNLSEHWSVAEFLATQHRELLDEQWRSWNADPALRPNGERLCETVLEPVRRLLEVPLHTTSGYRCGALNMAVGGRPTSRHVLALAADVIPVGMPLERAMHLIAGAMRAGALAAVDEAIIEMGWLHLQAAPAGVAPRQLALLTADGRRFEAYA